MLTTLLYIKVTTVLKNITGIQIQPGAQVKLLMPAKNNEEKWSADLTYSMGATGYWILRSENGAFKADYPKAFQPTDRSVEVTEALEKSMTVKFEIKK